MIIAIDGGDLVAISPLSNIELARAWVMGETTESHILAAQTLVKRAFESLNAEGYDRASLSDRDFALKEALQEDAEMEAWQRSEEEEEEELDG